METHTATLRHPTHVHIVVLVVTGGEGGGGGFCADLLAVHPICHNMEIEEG